MTHRQGPPRPPGRALPFPGRRGAAALLLAALLSLAGCSSAGTATAAAAGLEVRARPLDVPEAVGRQFGRLELLAAFVLASPQGRFGGLSAAGLRGEDILLLSDRGRLFRARRVEAADGTLQDLRGWSELPLPRSWRDADTEGMAVLPDGSLALAAEDKDELLLLGPDGRPAGTLPLPPFLLDAPANEGIEALAALPGGAGLLAVTEGLPAGPDRVAAARLAVVPGPAAARLVAGAPNGFRPTDAAAAGPALLMLQRRLTILGGLEARLVAVPMADVLAGAPLVGEELARLGAASLGENFEGVAARRAADGRQLIYLVADDNHNALQRTLLLQLAWRPRDDPPAQAAGPPPTATAAGGG